MISPDKTASIFSIHIKKQKKSKLYTKFASELSLFNNEKKTLSETQIKRIIKLSIVVRYFTTTTTEKTIKNAIFL